MGLFDDVLGKAAAALGSADASNPMMHQVTELINQHGGVAGIARQFQEKGLGDVVASWISTGNNLPVSGDQIASVLGSAKVQELAGKLGVSPDMLKSGVAALLPTVIDKMTPHGKIE